MAKDLRELLRIVDENVRSFELVAFGYWTPRLTRCLSDGSL